MTEPDPSAGRRYLAAAESLVARLADREWPAIAAAAELVADALEGGGTVHAFGTGHSHMLAEELFYRAGGLVRVRPILFEGLMLHAGAELSTSLERLPGLAEALLADHPMAPGDVLVVASNSGGNAVVSTLARLARQRGVSVIAIISRTHATSDAARSTSDRQLHAIADVVIDNGGVTGDAAIAVSGFATRVGPTSTVVGAAALNAIVAEAVERLVARGVMPDVFTSSNVEGGDAANARLLHPEGNRMTASAERQSPFAVRGVLEGYYGNPWTHAQRLELVPFLARRGMNTFVYGPKDDALVRRDWRLPYDGDALARLRELVETCTANGMDLVYCIAPGLSIRYASEDDAGAVASKLASVGALGVRTFGLLLDDIPMHLQHDGDRAAFTDLVEAQVALVGRVFDSLGDGQRLVVCPTVYSGSGDEAYLARLGAGIDPRIDLYWSGREICSHVLDLDDARRFERTTGRPPLYWDNYPVNDVAMTFELHVGPYRGRHPRLHEASRGIIANGMELFEASKIPFATIADYLADPEGYDPEATWARAIADVLGDANAGRDAEAFALFADNVRSSCLSASDAPVVTQALEAFGFRTSQGDAAGAAAALDALAVRLLAAADHLLRGPVRNAALIEECRPWIESFELGAQAIHHIAELAAAGRLEADGPAALLPYLARLREARVRVFGDAVDMTLADLTGTMIRPGRQLTVRGGDTA